jgi:hypothetical protein
MLGLERLAGEARAAAARLLVAPVLGRRLPQASQNRARVRRQWRTPLGSTPAPAIAALGTSGSRIPPQTIRAIPRPAVNSRLVPGGPA